MEDKQMERKSPEYKPKQKFTLRRAGLALLTMAAGVVGVNEALKNFKDASREAFVNTTPNTVTLDELPTTPWSGIETTETPPYIASTSTPKPSSTPTTSITQTATDTAPAPTTIPPTESPEPTATPESPFKFGEIDFSNGETFTMTVTVEVQEFVLSGKPIVYGDDFTDEERVAFLQEFAPGEGTVGVDVDKYGNIILYFHSGYSDSSEPLEAEELRKFIEGSNINNMVRLVNEEELLANQQKFVGQNLPINQGNLTTEARISAAAYLKHTRLDNKGNTISPIDDYENNTKDVLDVLIRETGDENSPFNKYKNGGGIFASFCLWKSNPFDSETGELIPGWYEWERNVFAISKTD